MSEALLKVPLDALHRSLGARMVPFAGYAMPVQYPAGLLAEHRHTRAAAGLFDVSHMGQLRLSGPQAGQALERVLPIDVIDLPIGKQRYGLLLNDAGGLRDDLMVCRKSADELFVVVNGACKTTDLAYLHERIGALCRIEHLDDHALLALQGPLAAQALRRLVPQVDELVFMTGADFNWLHEGSNTALFITRSGYTGEDGFELSVHVNAALALALALLAQPEVQPVGLGARNSLRLEAGLPLYGNDLDPTTTPVEAGLSWAIQKVRRSGGARCGTASATAFAGAAQVLGQLDAPASLSRRLVGLLGLDRVPVREHCVLQDTSGQHVGEVCSGLLSPDLDQPIALAYVPPALAAPGTRLNAVVRGKCVAMQVTPLPFVPHRYHRG